jgi:hypothetical protein
MDELKQTRVSVPIYRVDSNEAEAVGDLDPVHSETEVRWLDTREHRLSEYFDSNTGFVVPDSSVERRFL